MKVEIIGANVVTDKKVKARVLRLARSKIMNRQDGIDGEDMKAGPNRGVEAFFTK